MTETGPGDLPDEPTTAEKDLLRLAEQGALQRAGIDPAERLAALRARIRRESSEPTEQGAPADVKLLLECESPADADSLHRWLRREQAVRVDGALTLTTGGSWEAMGGFTFLTLIVGSGLSAAQLILAVASWRASRKPSPDVVVTQVAADGRTTRIEMADSSALAAALAELERSE
jgi:hypothetical protein